MTSTNSSWVNTRLGLDNYPIIHRELENPRSGTLRSLAQRALGIKNVPHATYGPPPRSPSAGHEATRGERPEQGR
jgi:hypothetical protein